MAAAGFGVISRIQAVACQTLTAAGWPQGRQVTEPVAGCLVEGLAIVPPRQVPAMSELDVSTSCMSPTDSCALSIYYAVP